MLFTYVFVNALASGVPSACRWPVRLKPMNRTLVHDGFVTSVDRLGDRSFPAIEYVAGPGPKRQQRLSSSTCRLFCGLRPPMAAPWGKSLCCLIPWRGEERT